MRAVRCCGSQWLPGLLPADSVRAGTGPGGKGAPGEIAQVGLRGRQTLKNFHGAASPAIPASPARYGPSARPSDHSALPRADHRRLILDPAPPRPARPCPCPHPLGYRGRGGGGLGDAPTTPGGPGPQGHRNGWRVPQVAWRAPWDPKWLSVPLRPAPPAPICPNTAEGLHRVAPSRTAAAAQLASSFWTIPRGGGRQRIPGPGLSRAGRGGAGRSRARLAAGRS